MWKFQLYHKIFRHPLCWLAQHLKSVSYLSVCDVAARTIAATVAVCGLVWWGFHRWLWFSGLHRRKHTTLVLIHIPQQLNPCPSSAGLRFILPDLLLSPQGLYMPHSTLLITDTQHLHEIHLHLLHTKNKKIPSVINMNDGQFQMRITKLVWSVFHKERLFSL